VATWHDEEAGAQDTAGGVATWVVLVFLPVRSHPTAVLAPPVAVGMHDCGPFFEVTCWMSASGSCVESGTRNPADVGCTTGVGEAADVGDVPTATKASTAAKAATIAVARRGDVVLIMH
jgi:hypothetical protein